MTKYIYCCDWGTTSLRLRLVNTETFEIIDQEKTGPGIAYVFNLWQEHLRKNPSAERTGFYLAHLQQSITKLAARHTRSDLAEVLVVISGMASSSIGIIELPYAELPFSLQGENALIGHIAPANDFHHPVILLSGVKDGFEVMRGEETQLVGLAGKLSAMDLKENTVVLLPGTHSKHVYIRAGTVTKIETHITGELFAILANNGLLKEAVQRHEPILEGYDWAAFLDGVTYSGTTGMLQALFKVRTNQLFNELTKQQNYDYLSGILIGSELRNLRDKEALQIILCSEDNLYHHYRKAIAALGLTGLTCFFDPKEMEQAVVRGQVGIANNYLNKIADERI